jgi:hypothetical protein
MTEHYLTRAFKQGSDDVRQYLTMLDSEAGKKIGKLILSCPVLNPSLGVCHARPRFALMPLPDP